MDNLSGARVRLYMMKPQLDMSHCRYANNRIKDKVWGFGSLNLCLLFLGDVRSSAYSFPCLIVFVTVL